MGLVQHDGAALQASSLVQRGTIYAYNWVVNTRKLGLRFYSGDDCIYGDNGTMHHNVVMGALGAIKSKGNDHLFYNNLVFNSWQSEDLQILRYYLSDKSCQPIGNGTVVMNNAGGTISAKATGYLDITSYAKYESQYNYNEFINTPQVRYLLRDYKTTIFGQNKMQPRIDGAKVFRPTATLTAKLLGPRLTLVHMSMGILTTSFQVIKILFQHFRYLLIILPRQSMMPT